MSFKDIALPYAQMGIKVFPLAPRDKVPALGEKWKEICTTDPEQIAKWDTQNPDYNVALVATPDSICILEFDIRGGWRTKMSQAFRWYSKLNNAIGKDDETVFAVQDDISNAAVETLEDPINGGALWVFEDGSAYDGAEGIYDKAEVDRMREEAEEN